MMSENETEDTDHHDVDHDDEDDHNKPWGLMIAFTLLLVNLVTLTGVLFLIPMLSGKARTWVKSVFWNNMVPDPAPHSHDPEKKKGRGNFQDIAIPSFASGVLLAMAVFLVIPEGLYLIRKYNGHTFCVS